MCEFSPVQRRTAGPNIKNPPKTWLKKFVKLTDHTCACNDLTNFECEANAITGNGSYVILQVFPSKFQQNLQLFPFPGMSFILKTCRIVAGASMISQFHKFLKSYFWQVFAI